MKLSTLPHGVANTEEREAFTEQLVHMITELSEENLRLILKEPCFFYEQKKYTEDKRSELKGYLQ